MATSTMRVRFPTTERLRRVAASVGGFLWHFLQMVLAMEVGMIVYHKLAWPLLAQTLYADWTDAYPLVGYWMMVAFMALGMLALMFYHRSSARYCFEMTGAMLAPIVALTVLVLCSLIPSHVLYGIGDPVMFVAMAAFMLYGPHDHAHHAHEQSRHPV